MRYLKEFETREECEAFKYEHTYKPYVYYIKSEDTVEYGTFSEKTAIVKKSQSHFKDLSFIDTDGIEKRLIINA